jgi:hypothetical protein
METTKLALFQGKGIRKTIYNNEWWFVISDVVEVLTETVNAKDYITKMKKRDLKLQEGWGQIVTLLSIQTPGGIQQLNCSNTEGIFRIIQSIPSPKAEPFKRWLARVGYERVQEIEDPELATKRTRILYKAKGYSDAWIEKRMRGVAIREELTDEWKECGMKEGRDYAILTAEISKATFGMTPVQYKKHKNIPVKSKANLRDNMTDLELIFTMLGEKVTTEISKNEKPEGFTENKKVSKRGGGVAGKARKDTEKELERSVISNENCLTSESIKRLS